MKKTLQQLLFGGLCAAILVAGNANAQSTKPKATEAKAMDAEAPKPYPFYGTVTNIDKSAKTISLGKKDGTRVLHTDGETVFEMDGHPASLSDVKVGYYLTGRVHGRASKTDNEIILKGTIHKEAPVRVPRGSGKMDKEKPAVTPAAPAMEETTTNAPAKKKKKTTTTQ